MKCLFTDILSIDSPHTDTIDSAHQLIPGAEQSLYKLEQGWVLLQQWKLDQYELLYLQSGIDNHLSFEIKHIQPCNCYFFCLQGKMEFHPYNTPAIYLKEGHGQYFASAPIQGFCSFRLNKRSPSLLIIIAKPGESMVALPFTFSPAIQDELTRIIFTSYVSIQHFHETQLEELIRLANLVATTSRPRIHFWDKDLEGIHLVKALIDQSPEKPFTLLALSRLAAMNMRKLNTGFKNLYKQTIFEYLHDKRMLIAHDRISSTHTTLKLIGKSAGYRTYANFSSAFKAHFGYTPSQLRKE